MFWCVCQSLYIQNVTFQSHLHLQNRPHQQRDKNNVENQRQVDWLTLCVWKHTFIDGPSKRHIHLMCLFPFCLFFSLCAHHTWDPFPNRPRLFHSTAAPDVSYIVFNIVEIFVYKVQCSLIFLWSALSLLFLPLFSSFCSLELGSPFVWIYRGLLSRWYLLSLPN